MVATKCIVTTSPTNARRVIPILSETGSGPYRHMYEIPDSAPYGSLSGAVAEKVYPISSDAVNAEKVYFSTSGGDSWLWSLVFGNGLYAGMLLDFTSLTSPSSLYTTSAGEVAVAANGDNTGLALTRVGGDGRGVVNGAINSRMIGAVSGSPGAAPTSWFQALSGGTITYAPTGGSGYGSLRVAVSAARRRWQFGRSVAANTTYTWSVWADVHVAAAIVQIVDVFSGPAGSSKTFWIDGVEVATGVSPSTGVHLLEVRLAVAGTAGTCLPQLGVGVNASITADATLYDPQFNIGAGRAVFQPTGLILGGPGYHAHQPTSGARGTWSSDGYWLGDGSDDCLISVLLPVGDMTIISAFYPTAASDAVVGTMAGSNTRSLGFGTDSSGNLTLTLGDASLSTSTIKGAVDIRDAWSVASAVGSGTTGTLRRNGAQIATGAVGGSVNTTIAYLIGAFNSNGTAAATLAGRIARILIVQRSNMSSALMLRAERAIGAGFVSI